MSGSAEEGKASAPLIVDAAPRPAHPKILRLGSQLSAIGLALPVPQAQNPTGKVWMHAVTNGEVQITRERQRYRATFFMEGGLVAITGRGASISMAAGGLPPETAAKLTLGRWVEEGVVLAEQDDAESGPEVPR